jgi:hypothetical protein
MTETYQPTPDERLEEIACLNRIRARGKELAELASVDEYNTVAEMRKARAEYVELQKQQDFLVDHHRELQEAAFQKSMSIRGRIRTLDTAIRESDAQVRCAMNGAAK